MTKTLKIISIFLTVIFVISTFSTAIPVFAYEYGDDHYAYGYDSAGNIVANKYDKTYFGSYFEKTYTYGDGEWKDQLSSFNGQDFGYDALGNPTLYKGATLTWSEGRRLASYNNGAYSLTFAYDSSGKRIKKTVNGMEYNYIYSGDTVIAITRSDNSSVLNFICDENGDYIGFTYGSGTYYYIRNLQNDVVAIADTNKNVLAIYSYDPWGNCTVSGKFANTIGDINPIRYRGYFYDEETGLYYVSSRYYDPEIGRFINADSQLNQKDGILGYNMFAYCHNNPIMYSDPTGHSITLACIIIGAVIGAVAGGCAGAYVSKKQTGKVNGWAVAAGAVGGGVVGGLVGWGVGAAITAVGAAATGSAATAAAPVVQQVAEKASTALQTYYPPNDGFSGAVQKITLEAGTLIQRTGDLVGRYIAPAGTPTQMLSLPYDKIGQPTTILQVQQSVEVLAGRVAPWFGQIGGGIQYQLGTPLDQLISEGIIKIFGG